MKLTNYIRDVFVDAVMLDVPEVVISKDEAQALFAKAMSPKLRRAFKDPEIAKCLKTDHIHLGGRMNHASLVTCGLDDSEVLSDFYAAQQSRNDVERTLRSTARDCSTLKQLQERLPDLVKYMPSEEEPTKNLPATLSIMPDLRKLGFKG